MKKQHLVLLLGQQRLHYSRFGEGKQPLLAFHGFGQSNEHLPVLEKVLASAYTVYAIDLFYHGRNAATYPVQPLSKADWADWMRAFFEQESLDSCSVLGFSLGGRFALATAEAFPDRVRELFLIAPDGIKATFWYSAATRPGWSQRLFKQVVYQPGQFQKLAVLARMFRLTHPKTIRFAQSQLDTPAKRHRLYHSWINFRLLRFDIPALSFLLNEKAIRTEVFVGKYDRLLTEKHVQPLTRRLKHYRLTVLESGHSQLLERTAAYLVQDRYLKEELERLNSGS